MVKYGLASVIVVTLATGVHDARANGRPAATSTIHFRQGHETDIVAGMTFGLVISHDGGTSWEWMCEAAVGYGGLYDPFYSYSSSGKLFASTFAGLKVNSDGCNFVATPTGMTFISNDQLGPDMSLYLAAADITDAKIYRSTDDGVSFPQSASPGLNGDWWQSVVIASASPSDVFLSGYRYVNLCASNTLKPGAPCTIATQALDCNEGKSDPIGNERAAEEVCKNVKQLLVFKSSNAGASFQPMPGNLLLDGVNTMQVGLKSSKNSTFDLVGASSDGSTLYARMSFENDNVQSDGLYKINTSTGNTWTRVLGVMDSMATVLRSNGDLVVITKSLGGQMSTNGGTSWTPLSNPPHANCVVENPADHSLWACTQNYGGPGLPSDNFGIMKTTDLANWTGVLKYEDIQKPVTCAAGTPQHDMCEAQNWCTLRQQLGITSTAIACANQGGADSPVDSGGPVVKPAPKGCCDTGAGTAPTALGAGAIVATLLRRRRRRKL
jgi:hypothetical protein